MEIIGYNEHGWIDVVTDDGAAMTVPDDMGNRDRQAIAEWEAAGNTIPPYVEPQSMVLAAVDTEAERRTHLGFDFQGHHIQTRGEPKNDMLKITGAAAAASIALTLGGKTAEDLRWFDPDVDFTWIDEANAEFPLDAPGMIALGQAAAAHVQFFVKTGRAIKNRIIAGEVLDPTDDALWSVGAV